MPNGYPLITINVTWGKCLTIAKHFPITTFGQWEGNVWQMPNIFPIPYWMYLRETHGGYQA
jgi:hypothetical protein